MMKEGKEKHESFKELEQKRELEIRENVISGAHTEGERTKGEILRSSLRIFTLITSWLKIETFFLRV
jgi:hypothetical protein